MKNNFAILFVLVTAAIYCFAGNSLMPQDCWKALQKVSSFHQLNSETNIPPEIISARNSLFPHQSRLLWAVTDGRYYVMQHQYIDESTNYSVFIYTTNHYVTSCCYTSPFKDFRTFVKSCNGVTLGNGF